MRYLTRLSTAAFLGLGSLSGSVMAQAATPSRVAQEMVAALQGLPEPYSAVVEGSEGKGYLQLDSTAYYMLTALKEGVDPTWSQQWQAELGRLGVRYNRLPEIVAMYGTPGLIRGGWSFGQARVVQADVAERYLSRLKLLSPELLGEWHTAMGRLNSSVNDLVLVHLLVSHEQLSIDSAFSGRAARELARLYSIPPASVAAWSAATGYPTIDAAFSLLKVQPLFSVDAFQQARFETALPLARQRPMAASALVQSASSELPNSGTLNDIAVGQTINGRLSESDPLYPDTTYYQRWQFTPREGQDVTIDLSSSEFDPVLIVRGLVNDDGGPGCASRVAFTARGSGAVTILVNTTSDPTRQTGAFTLSVSPTRKPVDPPGTRDCQPGNRRENMRETPERL